VTQVSGGRISHTGAPPLVGIATRPSDEADPSRTQKRVAVSPSGRQVLVDITSADRLRLIKSLRGRWPDVIMARERGESLEQIHRWARIELPPEHECRGRCEDACLRCYVSEIYAWIETELHDLAQRRALLLP
jgi:hypothetical protein